MALSIIWADVSRELRRALYEVRQVRVLEAQLEVLRQPAGLADVHLGELVADASATRVQHHPHPPPLIDAQLEEVVPRAERAELPGHLRRLLGG
jgi:hypothetical protein